MNNVRAFKGMRPVIGARCWVDPTAVVIGDVEIGDESSVWPLTVIRGEIEAMLDGVHEPDPEHLRVLLDEVAVMERLLDDLRTLSLAEAGALALYPEPIDLDDLIADVAHAYRSQADDAGVVISLDLDRTIDDVVLDPVRIRGVIANIIGNALHAMPDGGAIHIAAEQSAAAPKFDWSWLIVFEIVGDVRDDFDGGLRPRGDFGS